MLRTIQYFCESAIKCKKQFMAGVYSPAFLYANPIPPIVTKEVSPCQEVVHKATDPDFDLYRLVPAPTNTPDDAGP